MENFYTNEKNAQVVISLLKQHGIRKVIASPGQTNTAFIASIQRDEYFEIYSCVDERSAAYIACGLAAEAGEPVVISCTGATASRNYLPGMTEAYYRKLPVLAVTSAQLFSKIGHHVAQVVDRSVVPNDVARVSVALPVVNNDDDLWECEIKVNRAILELKRHGGGPAHINLPTIYQKPFMTKELPRYRIIDRISVDDQFPEISGRVAVFIGSHKAWSQEETKALDRFCAANDAVVFCDHTSGYRGEYRLLFALSAAQHLLDQAKLQPEILIHIGEITGDYPSLGMCGRQVWRVSPDGEIRDTFRKLRYVFEMSERRFFEHYGQGGGSQRDYLRACEANLAGVRGKVPDLPFSNIWVASRISGRMPDGAVIHFGILNSLRSWNFFEVPESVTAASNVGGFGIDGGLSSLIGASLARPDRICYCVIGDLAFFYDMNVLGNRHVGKNVRILLINNGKGTEFRQYNHHAAYFGDSADEFIAAEGHFGRKSRTLVLHYAEDLGFEYFAASSKTEFDQVCGRFLNPDPQDRPMLFEVFTDSVDESQALKIIQNLEASVQNQLKGAVKQLLGQNVINTVKSIIKS